MSSDFVEGAIAAAAAPTGPERRVLICDDDARRARKWMAAVDAVDGLGAVVEVLPPARFAGALRALSHRRSMLRGSDTPPPEIAGDSESLDLVEEATHLVVDYDLTPDRQREPGVEQDDSQETLQELAGNSGEDFAYLVRTLLPGRGLIVVNQRYQRTTFDLTLQRFLGTRADVNVSHEELGMASLWTGEGNGYRPWSWPRMIDVPPLLDKRANLIGSLDDPVLDSLGLGDELHLASFARSQLDPLGDHNPAKITFEQFALDTDLGLTPKDRSVTDLGQEHVRKLAAAAVGSWLEQYVVPAQNVLIDAPHLVQRYPGALREASADLASWDRVAEPDFEPEELDGSLAMAQLPASEWLDRPCWSWPMFNDRQVAGQLPGTKSERRVFCEDLSRFTALDEAHEFVTDVPGPYRQRYISQVGGVVYVPRGRLE